MPLGYVSFFPIWNLPLSACSKVRSGENSVDISASDYPNVLPLLHGVVIGVDDGRVATNGSSAVDGARVSAVATLENRMFFVIVLGSYVDGRPFAYPIRCLGFCRIETIGT